MSEMERFERRARDVGLKGLDKVEALLDGEEVPNEIVRAGLDACGVCVRYASARNNRAAIMMAAAKMTPNDDVRESMTSAVVAEITAGEATGKKIGPGGKGKRAAK